MSDEPLAGPDLDALIAEKVMGLEWRPWKPYGAPEGWFPKGAPTYDWRDENGHAHNPEGYKSDLPLYSFDIAAAWEVVGSSACEYGHKFSLEYEHDVWYACVSGMYEAQADTAPLAICRAALKAVGAAA